MKNNRQQSPACVGDGKLARCIHSLIMPIVIPQPESNFKIVCLHELSERESVHPTLIYKSVDFDGKRIVH